MKKNKKKLKLTKLTVANLNRLKAGKVCACQATVTDGPWVRDHTGNPCIWTAFPGCEL